MERAVSRRDRQGYESAVADLWQSLGRALVRLERIAECPPDRLADEALDDLPGLQYGLHSAAEMAVGIEPPRGGEVVHEELLAALAQARDSTAEVGLALRTDDQELAEQLLPEWRGALFRVRLARLRAVERGTGRPLERAPDPLADEIPARGAGIPAVAASALVLGGAILFTAGAVLAAWPLWAAGLALFAGGFLLVRP
ncbi:MAG: hypothetical protein E6G67_13580 [Actinobacteria bacterium]|nr:MAG: hypothetical protein E6G67_13580 [Actinomycetota bacterium]